MPDWVDLKIKTSLIYEKNTVMESHTTPIPVRCDQMNVTLYTREGCHLCDEANALLCAHGLSPRKVDIDENEQLRNKFDTCVPVVEIDGKIRFRGKVDPILLKRLLIAGSNA